MLAVGSSDTTITVNGTGFLPLTGARLNGNPRTSAYISPTSVSVLLPSGDLSKIGTLQFTVDNAGPGGGVSTTALQVNYSQPVITSLSPSSVYTGAGNQTIYLNGTGFSPATVLSINGSPAATTVYGSTEAVVTVPATYFASPGTITLVAANPAPGGGASAPAILTVSDAVPAAITLAPGTVLQGASTPATVAVTGSTFVLSSVVQVNGQSRTTTYIGPTQLSFRLDPSDQAHTGTLQVDVANPVPGGGASLFAPLTVAAPTATPVITAVNPTQFIVDTGASYIQVSGTGLAASSTILWNGTPLPTTPSPAGDAAQASIPANLISTPGTATITVDSLSAVPSLSNAVTVNIAAPPAPTLASVSPLNGPIGTAFTATITGTQFTQQSIVSIDGQPLPTTFGNPTSLTASVPGTDVSFGNHLFTIATPQPGGGTSSAVVYTAYVPQASNSMLFNPADGLLYLSIPGSAGAPYGNSVVSLDPVSGAFGRPIFVGSEPDHMALTSDGRYLWVGLDGASAVRKVDLSAGTAGLQFSLSAGTGVFDAKVSALTSIPGQTDSVVVAASGSNFGNIAIYDQGVPRAHVSNLTSQALQVDGTRNEIYSGASQAYEVFTYDSNGLTQRLSTSLSGALVGAIDGRLQILAGRTYSDSGYAIDAETGTPVGTFTASPYAPFSTAIDPTLGLAFALDSNAAYATYPTRVQVFNLSDFSAAGTASIPVNLFPNFYSTSNGTVSGLTRWGANGLAFRTGTAVFAFRSNLVEDLSSSIADLAVTVSSSGATTTGSPATYTAHVTNNGPTNASEVLLTGLPPATGPVSAACSSAGSCTINPFVSCTLGALNSGASATVTLLVNQLTPGTSTLSVQVSASQSDPDLTNNTASSTSTVTGTALAPVPSSLLISPSTVLAGSSDTTITVTGGGFGPGSSVQLDGSPLATTAVSGEQVSAVVPAASLASLGWHAVTVTTPGPGGGTSQILPLTVYTAIKAGVNRILYDPFSRKIIATLGPSTPNGNSLEMIDPETGAADTPMDIGSEPSRMALSDDGQVLYILLNGSNQLQRFNMLTQQPEFSLTPAAGQFSVQPGNDNVVAMSIGGFGIGEIADFNPVTQTASVRPATTGYNPAFSPQFLDGSDLLVENYQGIDDYSFTSNGFAPRDTSRSSYPLDLGTFKLAGKLAFTVNGGVSDFSTIPAHQLGSFPVSFSNSEGNLALDPAVNRTFFLAGFDGASTYQSYGLNGVAVFNSNTFLPAPFIPLDLADIEPTTTNLTPVDLLRWGQDGLAALTSSGTLYLVRGPAVLPQLLGPGVTPSLVSPAALQHGGGNTILATTGANFQPGVAAAWNGSYRTTTYIDATHANVLVPASDLVTAGTVNLTFSNPGSAPSAAVAVTIQ